jgi:hypothetical protein
VFELLGFEPLLRELWPPSGAWSVATSRPASKPPLVELKCAAPSAAASRSVALSPPLLEPHAAASKNIGITAPTVT